MSSEYATPTLEPRAPDLELPSSCQSGEALDCLLAINRHLHGGEDLRTGLLGVAAHLAEKIEYDSLAVLLLDELGRELRFLVALGYGENVERHWRFGLGQGIVGSAAQTGSPIRVSDVRQDSRHIDAGESARSEIAIPLFARGRLVGVLDLASRRPEAFSKADEELLTFVAPHLGQAIDTARLYQNTREQARTLSLLHEASRELSSILDRRELLTRMAERLRTLVPYDLFSVFLYDDARQVLVPWVTLFGDGRDLGDLDEIPLGVGLCGTSAALRQPVRVPNVGVDPRFVPCTGDLEVRSELVVPLTLEGRLLGVIDLESASYDAFTAQHEETLSTLAASIAISLENARLYERAKADEERIAQDLAMAREIQRQLLPKSTPWVPGLQMGVAYRPARQLGGDFYAFIPYPDDGKVAVAVGDVAGKATPAALYGSLALGILREYSSRTYRRPCRVLADLNHRLHELGIGNRFLALAYAVYDRAEGTVTVANSGLPHPFLVRDGVVTDVEVAGVPLGLLGDRDYQEEVIEVAPGDVLVLATDGLEESQGSDGEELGRDRIRSTLARLPDASAREIAEALMEDTEAWSDQAEAYDDRTIVALRFVKPAS